LNIATDIFNRKTAPLQAGIKAGVGVGAAGFDFFSNPDRPSVADSSEVGAEAVNLIPNIQAPTSLAGPSPSAPVDPFGVTQEQVEQAGNADFGAPSLFPTSQFGVNSLGPEAVSDIQATNQAQPQIQPPQAQGGDFGLIGFTPEFPGQTPSQQMRGEGTAEATTFQGTDAQGRLRQFASPEAQQANIAQGQADFAQASTDREGRIDQNFGEARGPDSRDDVSGKPDFRALARAQGAKGSAVNAQAAQLEADFDLKRQGGASGPTRSEDLAERRFQHQQNVDSYNAGQDSLVSQGKAQEAFEQDEALLRQVSGDAGRIGRLTNEAIGLTTEGGTTALSGSLLKNLPGTDANQLKEVLSVVSSKVALDRLMEIKKTGATLGQVSEKELELLQNSYDALKQNLKPERLRKALVAYATNLKAVEDKTAKAFVAKHGQAKFDAIMGGGDSASGAIPNDRNATSSGDALVDKYNK
jgi:hypothetical protein